MHKALMHDDTIYCHGLPGSPEEIYFLTPEDKKPSLILAPHQVNDFIDSVSTTSRRGLHIIGFSIGALGAVKVAEACKKSVSQLSLISPAAPLELGHFTEIMAGRLVFQTAIRSAFLLRILTTLQYVSTTISSDSLIKALFKNGTESELELLSDPAFIKSLKAALSESYGKNSHYYRQTLLEYVRPWGHRLENITCPVNIYHGFLDSWAPITMAYALQQKFHSDAEIVEYENLGHFSTLRKALPQIINGIYPDRGVPLGFTAESFAN